MSETNQPEEEVWSSCKCGSVREGTPQDNEQAICPDCKRIGCYVLADEQPEDPKPTPDSFDLDCGSHLCWFAVNPTGQRTNSCCRCFPVSTPTNFKLAVLNMLATRDYTRNALVSAESAMHHVLADGGFDTPEDKDAMNRAIVETRYAIGKSNYSPRLIAAAPETAAERDRLKEINAELVEALTKINLSTSCPINKTGLLLTDVILGLETKLYCDIHNIAVAAIAKATNPSAQGEKP